MDKEFRSRRLNKRGQIIKLSLFMLLIVLLVAVLLWWENYKWIPVTIPVICSAILIYPFRRMKYNLKDNGDLTITNYFPIIQKQVLSIWSIELIEYTLNPGRKSSIMLESKDGFHFLNPDQPKELINAIKQMNPTIKVEVN